MSDLKLTVYAADYFCGGSEEAGRCNGKGDGIPAGRGVYVQRMLAALRCTKLFLGRGWKGRTMNFFVSMFILQ